MVTAEHLARAEAIARDAHAAQVDKQGQPYILHVERVVAAVEGNAAKAAAWLHDVLEDTDWTEARLFSAGIPPIVIFAVVRVTKAPTPPGLSSRLAYRIFIRSIVASKNPIALAVKLADVKDHLGRPDGIASMRPKYEEALAILEGREV